MTDNPPGTTVHLRADNDPAIVTVDNRGRVALGTGAARLYIRRDEPDGVIVLIPAMVLPASTVAAIDSAIEDSSLAAARSRAGSAGARRPVSTPEGETHA